MGGHTTTAAETRAAIAYQNRWKSLWDNPKIVMIALFAS